MKFEVDTPQGKFEVEAPDMDTAMKAIGQLGAPPPRESATSQNLRAELSDMTQNPRTAPQPQVQHPLGASFNAATEGSQAGLMGGYDDEIGAAMMAPIHAGMDWVRGNGFDVGKNYTRLQQELDARKGVRRQEHPVASLAGEVAGGLALGGGAAKAGLSVAGRALPVVGKTGAAAIEGGAYGALYGAGEAKPGERMSGAATGALVGAGTGAALETVGGALARRAARRAAPPPPSTDELASASQALYRQSEQAGVTVKAPAVDHLVNNVKIAAGRLNEKLRPNTVGILDDAAALQGRDITLQELDEFRQVVGQSMQRAEPQDVRTLERIKNVVDHFADNIKPQDITGDIRGFDYIKQGRELWARKSKSQMVDQLIEKAKNQATGFENGLVIQFRKLANNPQNMAKFSKEEQDMIRAIVRRPTAHGVLRAVGMLAPNSTFGGIAGLGVAGLADLGTGAAVAGIGAAAKAGAGAMTRGKVNALQSAVARGSIPMLPQLPNKARPFIGGGVAASTEIDRLLRR